MNALRCLMAVGLLASWATFAPAADPGSPAPASYDVLRKASMFTIGGVGFAGTISDEEKAFRSLLAAPDAKDHLHKLARQATTAGQVYAVLGLKLLNDPSYREESSRLAKANKPVTSMSGCILFETTSAALAKQIADGKLK